MEHISITHELLEGGKVYLRRSRKSHPWLPTICIWPDGSRQDALRAVDSVGLDLVGPRNPKLVEKH